MTPEQNRNSEIMKQSLYDMQQRLEKIHEGGGKKAIEKQRERNKLTARERIAYLVDDGLVHFILEFFNFELLIVLTL